MLFLSDLYQKKNNKKRKMTFHAYSKLWGVHHVSVAKWFSGKIPHKTNLNMIANFFSIELKIPISADDLINKNLKNKFSIYKNEIKSLEIRDQPILYFDSEAFLRDFSSLSPSSREIIIKLIKRLKKLEQNERGLP